MFRYLLSVFKLVCFFLLLRFQCCLYIVDTSLLSDIIFTIYYPKSLTFCFILRAIYLERRTFYFNKFKLIHFFKDCVMSYLKDIIKPLVTHISYGILNFAKHYRIITHYFHFSKGARSISVGFITLFPLLPFINCSRCVCVSVCSLGNVT